MAKKKSFDQVAKQFKARIMEVEGFLDDAEAEHINYRRMFFEQALMRSMDAFEHMCFEALLAAMNRAETLAIPANLPKHLNISVCRYLVVGDGYFDLRSFNDYRSKVKEYLGKEHGLYLALDTKWRTKIDTMLSIRNACAHPNSAKAHTSFRTKVGLKKGSPGAYLRGMIATKKETRYDEMTTTLLEIGEAIRKALNATLK